MKTENPGQGCTCPSWRYHPRYPRPTHPECSQHGVNGQWEDGK